MTLENVQKQYKHFCKLSRGEFNERDFDIKIGEDRNKEEGKEESESGITLQGKMTPQRVELIKSNALRHKLDIEKKFPQLLEPVKQTKSKEKK